MRGASQLARARLSQETSISRVKRNIAPPGLKIHRIRDENSIQVRALRVTASIVGCMWVYAA